MGFPPIGKPSPNLTAVEVEVAREHHGSGIVPPHLDYHFWRCDNKKGGARSASSGAPTHLPRTGQRTNLSRR